MGQSIEMADAKQIAKCVKEGGKKGVDPNEEESKGGSGEVGKMLLSAGDNGLALINYVPAPKADKVNAEEWMAATLKEVGGGDVKKSSPSTCVAHVAEDKAKGLFPQADEEEDDWVPDESADIEW